MPVGLQLIAPADLTNIVQRRVAALSWKGRYSEEAR
jgi:hypothetical protein